MTLVFRERQIVDLGLINQVIRDHLPHDLGILLGMTQFFLGDLSTSDSADNGLADGLELIVHHSIL
jgi:hypothetical protein